VKTISSALALYRVHYEGYEIIRPEGMRPLVVHKGKPALYLKPTHLTEMLADKVIKRIRSHVKGVARYVKT